METKDQKTVAVESCHRETGRVNQIQIEWVEVDASAYLNSGEWFIKPQRKIFGMMEVDHYKDEE